jgi:hypothetical protein
MSIAAQGFVCGVPAGGFYRRLDSALKNKSRGRLDKPEDLSETKI